MKTNFKGKFIVTLFLCFALCLAVLPFIGSTAFADGEHIHCVCGIADCDDAEHGEAKGFSVLDVDSGYLSGNYYLTEDFYLQNDDYFLVKTGKTLNLCLNGHNIVANEETFAIFNVECGGTFNLCDCKGTGCIMGVTNGACAIWADSDEESSGNFNMYGGKICDNDVIVGGVYNLGNFVMYGGEISGNEAYYNSESEEVGNGGGVNNLGYFAMYGGKIFDNTATIGGGVYNGLDFEMYGGEISGNTATQNGGGVYNDSSFLMSGGEITNNEAVDDELMGYGYGDGVYARDYTTIAYFNNEKAVDGAKIIGNVKDNLYLESEVVITVKGSLTENSSIGITYSEELPQGGVKIIQGSVGDYDLTEEDVKKFKADVSGQTVIYDGTSFGWLTVKQHTHCSCGDLHCEEEGAGHEKIVFNGVTEYIPKDGFNGCHGNYYLENDISPSGFYEVKSGYTLNICLNGHVLSGNNLLQDNPLINNSGTLNIFDCDNTTTHKFVEETNKAWVHDDVSGTKTVNGGVITGVYSAYDNSAIYNTGVNSVFNLYGGTIAGNFVRGSFAGGGGVFVGDGAIFNMYNGAIVHNYSEEYGGGVYVASGSTFNMYNGTIANNSAMFGGAVIVSSGLESAVFNMSGGEITNNTATYGGGVTCYGEFVMSGGSITNNTATYYGGGVDNENTVTINGGSITGNKSPLGGGVYNSLETSMNLSGNVAIKENTIVDGLDKSNVYMGNGSYIGITSALTCGAESIGITTERWPTSAKAILIAQSAVAQNCDATKFFDDTDSYCIKKGAGSDANKLYLAEIHTHVWAFSNPSTYFMVYCDMDSSCEYSLASTDNKGIRLTVLSDNIEKAYTGEPIVYENYTNDITAVIGAEPTIYYQKRLENEALSARTTEAPTEMGSYSVIIGLDVGQYLEIYTNMTIGKAKITGESILTEPTARTGLVYDGSAQELVNAGAVKDGFVIKYSLDSVVWTEEIPTGTNANNYTVFWKVCGGEEYDDYDNTPPLFINVAPKDITGATITLGQSLTYNGYEQTEQIVSVIKGGITLTTNDYTFSGNTATNAGTHTLTVLANGNFTGTVTKEWSIAPKEIVIDWCEDDFTYNSHDQKGNVTAVFKDVFQNDISLNVIVDGEFINHNNNADYTFSVEFASEQTNYVLPSVTTKSYHIKKASQDKPIVEATGTSFVDQNDGKIILVTTAMEYRKSSEVNYTAVTGTEVTGLSYGTYYVRFKATDNYNVSNETQVIVLCGAKYTATLNFATGFNLDKTYDGQPVSVTISDYVYNGDGTVQVVWYENNNGVKGGAITAPQNAGKYFVGVYATEGETYEAVAETTKSFTISKATRTITISTNMDKTYDGSRVDNPDVQFVGGGTPYFEYVKVGSTDSYSNNRPLDAGSYTVRVTLGETENYEEANETKNFTIAKKNISANAQIVLDDTNLVYNGNEQTKQIVSVTVDELSVTYDVENNTNKGTNATTYTLKIVANGNFEGEKTVTWNIAVKKVAKPDADTTVFTYNGNEQTYTLVADDSYEISGNVGKEAVGYVAKVSLKDKVNCQWEDEKTDDLSFAWTIAKKDITNAVITLGSAVLVENGQVQTQVIESVKVGDITLTADDYTLSGNTATNAGTHTLTILAKGNFTGSVTQKFVILPKAIEEAVKETTTDGKEVLVIGDGNVNVEVKKENEATPETKLVSNKLDVIENVLDGTELSKVAGGEDYNIWIEVKSESAGDVVIEENKKTQIEQKVTERGEEYHVGAYIDISMYKKLASDVSSQTVRELKSKIKISISVPQDILKSSRSYFIIRNHDGEVEIIDADFDQTENSLTFETDRFSAYAIGYHEVAEEVITNQENCKICNTLPVLFLGLCWRAWVVIVIAIVVVLIVLWLLIKNFTKKKKNGKGNGGNGLTETATMTTTDTTENVTTDATQTKTNDASEENVSVDQTTTTDKAENDIIVKDTTATVLTENETEDETEENDVESEDDEAEEETLDFGGSFARYNKSFKAKLIQASAEVQGFYQTLKNHLLGYQNVASRMSWQNDTVHTKRTNICKFAIRGKSLYIYLPLTDEEMQATNITKISQTKRYESVKSFTKIKGSLSLKRAIKGIDLVCARLGLTFVADQTVDYGMPFESTEALIEKGLIKVLKQRTRPVSVEEARKAILDSVALEKVSEQVRYSTGTKKAIINIDTISNSYKDGETVTVDNLIEKGLISKKTDYIKALARGTLDKSITVIADDFSIDAVKMILLAGGKVIKLVKKEK